MYSIRLFGYKVYNLFYYFIIYAFIGWLIETVYLVIQTGSFVNRGFLFAPICPIYGFGMLLIFIFLKPVKHNLPLYFIGAVSLTTLLEYVTGKALELLFNKRLWDYSQAAFNIDGLICLSNSLAWGILAIVIFYIMHPLVRTVIRRLSPKTGEAVIYILLIYISLDITATVLTEGNIEYLLFFK
jgi:uncharacterized membrane protein